mgnify:CR=1 FL=1
MLQDSGAAEPAEAETETPGEAAQTGAPAQAGGDAAAGSESGADAAPGTTAGGEASCAPGDMMCETALSACPDGEAGADCREAMAACPTDDAACYQSEALAHDVALDAAPAAVEPAAPVYAGIVDLFQVGGPIIAILAVLSVISLAIILVKIVQFAVLNVSARSFVQKAADRLKACDLEGALSLLEHKRGPVARVMEAAVRGKAMGADDTIAREEVTRVAQRELEGLEAGLPYLSLIATISPLLGLLGTVLGMIDAFQQLEGAGDRVDPAILSGGIWEALLTTAAGLSVAIPAAAVFTWLQRTVDVVSERMEDAATRVFTVSLFQTEPSDGEAG